ncbi:MAG: zinc ABC transporter substrate-binding protein, partial [Clostridia bacterium]|nr:zinc ABC transporter substrate-binding protein [Clostridia bacterium]
DRVSVTNLLPAGGDSHSFEPTPKDIVNIKNCDLFIYIGGESDAYISDILSSLDAMPKTLVMTEHVTLSALKTDADDSHSHDSIQLDEHIWTSPDNCRIMCRKISEKLCEIDPDGMSEYSANAEVFDNELMRLDNEFSALADSIDCKVLIFGDRFPFLYFAKRYGFEYYSAFPGCGGHSEPSAATVSSLIETAERLGVSAIFYTETSSGNAARSIAEHTGTDALMLHSCHNITAEEYKSGVTYISLMENNLKTLKEAFSVAAD